MRFNIRLSPVLARHAHTGAASICASSCQGPGEKSQGLAVWRKWRWEGWEGHGAGNKVRLRTAQEIVGDV